MKGRRRFPGSGSGRPSPGHARFPLAAALAALPLASALAALALPAKDGPARDDLSPPSVSIAAADTVRFHHGDHANLDCRTCHANSRPTVRTNQVWCAECHHEGTGFDRCGECHPASDLARPYGVRQRLTWTAGGAISRALPFEHTEHAGLECGACHRGAPMPTPDRPCADCHAEHHRAESSCWVCHEEPRPDVHALEVHATGCGGSSCHGTAGAELAALGDASNVCLSCHQDQRDHERGEGCTRCHLLGPAADGRPGADGGRSGGAP